MTRHTHFPTVGIIGAGQMARMLIEAASRLNIDIKLFSKDLDFEWCGLNDCNNKEAADNSIFNNDIEVYKFFFEFIVTFNKTVFRSYIKPFIVCHF